MKIKHIFFILSLLLYVLIIPSTPINSNTILSEKLNNDTIPKEITNNIIQEIQKKKSNFRHLNPDEVKVGAYLLNMRRFEVAAGSWIADFYVWVIWNNKDISPTNLEVVNGVINNKDNPPLETFEVDGVTYNWLTYRITATISSNLIFKRYPLDVQTLTIEIEDQILGCDKMKYVSIDMENNIDDYIKIQGWEIKEKFTELLTHKYKTNFGYGKPGDKSFNDYSRMVFGIKISRPTSTLIKLLVPLCIILSLSFLAFLLTPDKLGQRISLGVSTIFASVAYHINVTSGIPQVSYLTLVDRLMIIVYFTLLCSLINTIMITKFVDSKEMDKAIKINKIIGILLPITSLSIIIYQFFIY